MSNARLEELRVKFQENPRRYFAPYANELRKAGDPAQAIAVCRVQLATQPGHVSGHIVLGQALYEAGETKEAGSIFTAALELDPENLIALRTLGEIAQVNGEFSAARQWYQRLLDADPRNSEVAQLLRDIPSEVARAPEMAAAAPPLTEEPTPKTVQDDIAAAEIQAPQVVESVPAPKFHTTFSGSGPAYDPDAPRPEPTSTTASSEPEQVSAASDEPFVDLQPTAHEEPAAPQYSEPVTASARADDHVEMVDFDEVPEAASTPAEPVEHAPDESMEFLATAAGDDEAVVAEAQPAPVPDESDEFDEMPAGASTAAEPGVTEEPTTDQPRAVFAERGFDGPVNEDLGWMTTPSAAFSDLEAAPEDWFAGPAHSEPESAAPESPSSEDAAEVNASAPDHATDSWFEDVGGASAIESTEVSSDEFWLPPELPHVITSAESQTPSAEAEQEPVAAESTEPEPDTSWGAPAPEPAYAAAEDTPSSDVEQHDWAPVAGVDEGVAESTPVSMEETPEVSAYATPDESGEFLEQPAAMYEEESAVHQEPAPMHEEPVASYEEPSAIDEQEREQFDVHDLAEAGEEAVAVVHPDHSTQASLDSEREPESAPDVAEPVSADAETEIVYASSMTEGASEAHSDRTEVASAPTPAPFITETLAELYLQQGFKDEALSIYRQLLDRNPSDQTLRDRVEAIEKSEVRPTASAPEQTAEDRIPSQSVRMFFSRLARRPASSANAHRASSEPQTPAAETPFGAAASALANMFSASSPSSTDENAASTLAGAFTDPAGRPSRAAERELSLDHLFRDVAPVGSQPVGSSPVTLDEFYATPNASTGSSTEPGEAESDEPAGSDIRQFTAWLEGLRKK